MPIRREFRSLYPAHWRELSRRVRFERAQGMCQGCGRPHGATVRCLPDGRWYENTWCDRRGRIARWPDLEQTVRLRTTRVVLAAAHLDHDPTNNRLRNLRSLCQRCHLIHDRPHHLAQRRITQDLENVNEIAKLPTIRNRTHAVSTAFAFTRFVVDALRKPDTELMLRENGNITRIVMPELQLGRNRPPEAPSRPQPPMEEERDMA